MEVSKLVRRELSSAVRSRLRAMLVFGAMRVFPGGRKGSLTLISNFEIPGSGNTWQGQGVLYLLKHVELFACLGPCKNVARIAKNHPV